MSGLVKLCATEICSFAFSLMVNDWHSIRTKVIGKQKMSRYLESSLSERYWILQLYLRFEKHDQMKSLHISTINCLRRHKIGHCLTKIFRKKVLSSIAFVWTNIYYMCLGKLGGPWRSPGPKFASEVALRCQALPLSKRLSLWSGWVGQKRVSGWILRDEETERDDGGNRRGDGLFIPFSLLNLLVL